MPKTTETGKLGEQAALGRLTEKGMSFLAANYRYGHYEIDLVMRDGDYVVFVEVKARSSAAYGLPRESVTRSKQLRLIRAAEDFLMRYGLTDAPVRFDVAEVYLDSGKIVHIPNAFGTD